jgi:hypothetical protein
LETDLYLPIKRYLEKLGLEVKGEVRLRSRRPFIAVAMGIPSWAVLPERPN